MLVFGEELSDQNNAFKITDNTDKVFVGFFGFYPHHLSDKFEQFLDELEIEELADDLETDFELFNPDDLYGLVGYQVCDRRTFDISIVLPKTFNSEKEALEWFDSKCKNSKVFSEYDFKTLKLRINVMDASKLLEEIKERVQFKQLEKSIDEKITKEINHAREILLKHFADEDNAEIIIQNKVNSILNNIK